MISCPVSGINMKYASILIAVVTTFSCNSKSNVNKRSPAILLNDSAVSVFVKHNDARKALLIIDNAISLDSNNMVLWQNKVTFQLSLQRYKDALLTVREIEAIKRSSTIITMEGLLYYKLGKIDSSMICFSQAYQIDSIALDTMKPDNKLYKGCLSDKGFLLILLDRREEGLAILKDFCDKDTVDWQKTALKHLMTLDKKSYVEEMWPDQEPDTTTFYGVQKQSPPPPRRIAPRQ